MRNQENIHLLIIRLFSGEATVFEKNKIKGWIDQSNENKKLFHDLRDIWLLSGNENNADEYNLEKTIKSFREQIKKHQRKKISLIPLLKYAAIAILLISLPLSYFIGGNQKEQQLVAISCPYGDRSKITLPDNTEVWLNSGSKLIFNSDFKNSGRNVLLEGEAFFSVTKDEKNPFQVNACNIDIKVLGTQFNVKAYPEDNIISATLVEGSVEFLAKNREIRIKPDQKLVYNKTTSKIVVTELEELSSETGWKDGRLIFRNESMAELAPKLERWFDVDIVFADETVKTRRFTGNLEHESILEVVAYLDISKLVECKIEGNKIIIQSE